MSNLTEIDRCNLGRLFGLDSGYVLGNYFTNREFQKFILRLTKIDICNGAYIDYSSKGKKLRYFWDCEKDELVGKVNEELLKILKNLITNHNLDSIPYIAALDPSTTILNIDRMIERSRILQSKGVDVPSPAGETWEALQQDIQARLAEDKPEFVVDRLHTYATKYLIDITREWGIQMPPTSDKLQDYAGEINRFLTKFKLIDSSFSRKIVGMCAKLLTEYSDLRNNKSYAHVNEILTHDEAILAVKTVSALLCFLESIKADIRRKYNVK